MAEQTLREWMAKKIWVFIAGEGEEPIFPTLTDYKLADAILAELNRRIDASALTDEQINKCCGFGVDFIANDSVLPNVAAAQLKATKEALG